MKNGANGTGAGANVAGMTVPQGWQPKTYYPVLLDTRPIGNVLATVEAWREERGSVFYVDCRVIDPVTGRDVIEGALHFMRGMGRQAAIYKATDLARWWFNEVATRMRPRVPQAAQAAPRVAAPKQAATVLPAQPAQVVVVERTETHAVPETVEPSAVT